MDGPANYSRWLHNAPHTALAVVLCCAIVPRFGLAQELVGEVQQRAFSVSEVELQEAARQVRELLAGDGQSVVFADRDSNRLLVQATADKLQAVDDLLGRLDQPPAQEESFLRAYAVKAQQRDETVAWAEQFRAPEGTRVAFDAQTNQLLVMGPAKLHDFVRTQLQATAPGANRPAAASEPPAATSDRPAAPATAPTAGGTSRQLQLTNMTGESLHRRLEQLLNRPLPVTTSGDGDGLSFRAEFSPGDGVAVDAKRTTGQIHLSGAADQVDAWTKVLSAMDNPESRTSVTQLVTTKPATEAKVREALRAIEENSRGVAAGTDRRSGQLVSMLFQPEGQTDEVIVQPDLDEEPSEDEDDAVAAVPFPGGEEEDGEDVGGGALLGPVQVQFVEGLDIILIRGNRQDVERVREIISRIEQVSAETVPAVEVLPLEHVESQAMAQLLQRVYAEVLGPRTGTLNITPLGKPNALLLVGRPESVETATELVERLDVPVEPTTQFEVFPLKHAVAANAKELIDAFLTDRAELVDDDEEGAQAALPPRAMIVADFRTNSLIVNAGPRDLAEIEALVERIDVDRGTAMDEVRIFSLKNTIAADLAEVLRSAVLAREDADTQEDGDALAARSSALRFVTIDPETQQEFESGVLANIRISADSQSNSLVVTAPSESMPLIAALIEKLDRVPDAEAEIKVFTIVNGDAVSMAAMIRELFGTGEDADEGPGVGAGDSSLVRLQVSVDERTNSIIAAGTQEDLAVVYAILLQLDASESRQRKTEVYRLKNSPAEDVATALNEWLRTEREAEAAADLAISPFEQIEREVVIVPELVSNSLIVSATPRFFEDIADLIDELDERPAMVMIQVLIAEVRLNDTDEFGVELGLQDSILFDRSVLDLDNFQTISTTINEQSPGGATVSTQQETIVNAPLVPGFNFNNQDLGNNGSEQALASAGNLAAQGLSNFALNRVNSDLGFGGFVFSASSDSISTLLRALQESRRLEVLSRPQITALDNQLAVVRVGQRVPRVQSTQVTQFGQQNSVIYEDVGIILQVQPRVSPDGMVVMTIQAEKSQVGAEAEGIPIFTGLDGSVVRAPRIDQIITSSTVAAASGQTIVLSGLISKDTFDIHRRVPILADVPLLGDLFRYDAVTQQRNELLVIMTPRVIKNEADAEMIKQVESSRMSWVLSDVVNLHGPSGLRGRSDEWAACESESVYPTHMPEETIFPPTPSADGPMLPAEEESMLEEPTEAPVEEGDDAASTGDTYREIDPVSYQQPQRAKPVRLPPPGP